ATRPERRRDVLSLAQREPETLEYPLDVRIRNGRPEQPADAVASQAQNGGLQPERIPIDQGAARSARANELEERARAFHRCHRQPRVGAAFEAGARFGLEAEPIAGATHLLWREVGALEDDGLRLGVDLAVATAHDAGNCNGTLRVRNHQHLCRERAQLAIERAQRLFRPRGPDAN